MAYRFYMADALKTVSENTAKQVGGSCITVRFADVLNPKPEDNRTAEDIIAELEATGIIVRKEDAKNEIV
jgi:hypothetical protein